MRGLPSSSEPRPRASSSATARGEAVAARLVPRKGGPVDECHRTSGGHGVCGGRGAAGARPDDQNVHRLGLVAHPTSMSAAGSGYAHRQCDGHRRLLRETNEMGRHGT